MSTSTMSNDSYWTNYHKNMEPCHFPVSISQTTMDETMLSTTVEWSEARDLLASILKEHDSLIAIMQSAWSLVLNSYTGLNDISFLYEHHIISQSSKRSMQTVRLRLSPEQTLHDLAKTAKENYLEGNIKGSPSSNLLEDNLKFHNTTIQCFSRSNDGSAKQQRTATPQARGRITLRIDLDAADITLFWPKSWFSLELAQSVTGTLSKIIGCIALQPRTRISDVEWISNQDSELLLRWNSHDLPPSKLTLHGAFYEQVRKQPTAEAICAWDGTLTYRELYNASQRLCSVLRAKGVRSGVKVPICFDKSKFAVISMLAILSANGCFVPLDPQSPPDRLQQLIWKLDATIVLCSSKHKDLVSGMAKTIIPVGEFTITRITSLAPEGDHESQDAAYCIFTSGSTGMPKAVVIQHQAIMSSIQAHGKALGLSPRTRCLQFSAFVWDISIFEIWTVFSFGGTTCIPSEHDRLNRREESINSMRVNFASMTPTVCKMIDPTAVPHLQKLLLIGEAMTQPIIQAWSQRILINAYGPAEASVMCHLNFPMTPDKNPNCFGYPVGCRAWIVDRHNHHRLMPLGSIGELLLEGPLLSQGYYNDPVKTSEAYIVNPAWTKNQSGLGSMRRLYSTGDLARLNPDGTYEFAGRKDTQIKFHGARVELAELEFNLLRDDSVKHAIVLLPKSGPCTGRLVAIVQPANVDGKNLSRDSAPLVVLKPTDHPEVISQTQSLKDGLKKHIPEWMIPSVIIVVEKVPVMAAGKLDRVRVARFVLEMDDETYNSIQQLGPIASVSEDDVSYKPSELELELRSIFAYVLKRRSQHIGFKQSFLGLGGDSLSAMHVSGQCRKRGIDIPVHLVLRSPSILELATQAKPSTATKRAKTIEPQPRDPAMFSITRLSTNVQQELDAKLSKLGYQLEDVEEVYECSALQQGIMLGRTRNAEAYASHATHKVISLDSSKVDVNRLLAAWQQIIDRHAALRTVFVEGLDDHDTLHSQVVLKKFTPNIVPIRASSEDEAIALIQQTSNASYEDGRSPLHHLTVCVSATIVYCKLEISHAIMDGASISIIYRDLARAYSSQLDLAERPLYSNYLHFLRNLDTKHALDYWKQYLYSVEPCHFPVLIDSPPTQRLPKAIRLELDFVADLQTYCDNNGFTFSNALMAAWALTLRSYTGNEDVTFGYISSGREDTIAGAQDAVGPYINMLTCHLNIPLNLELKNVLLQAQQDFLEAMPYQHIALAEVQHALELTEMSLFNTLLSYRKLPANDFADTKIGFEEVIPTFDPDEYNISINIEAGEKTMAIDFTYWTDCLGESQAQNVSATFQQALRNIAHNADKPINALQDTLGIMQVAKLAAWNKIMPETINICVHDLIHSQVLSRPQAQAIDGWDGKYTYAELDQDSTKLATHIVSLCKGQPNPAVLTCFHKSVYTIVAYLAILKAGGRCVPLDAEYPKSAIEIRAKDTQAQIALVGQDCVATMRDITKQFIAVDAEFLNSLPNSSGSLPLVRPTDCCFIVYTSGSTGQPKGVVLEHRNLASSAAAHGPLFGINADSRVLQFASYTFDNSLEEIFTSLIRGACVCVPSDHERLNDLGKTMNRLQVSFADLTASVASFLNPDDVPSLKRMVLGGEAVTNKVLDIWRGSISVCGGYGPSECSINCSYSKDITSPGRTTNIGTACGCVLWVVDADDYNKLVPIGAPGELLVEGPIVSRGYLNDEVKTQQAFIKDPAWTKLPAFARSGATSRRMYMTGDIVYLCTDGSIMYLGRKDHQVKVNGQRLEIGEVETQLERCLPNEYHSAVELVTIGGQSGAKKELAAFVCSKNPDSMPLPLDTNNGLLIVTDGLRRQYKTVENKMAAALPSYYVPTAWIPMSKLPLSSAGKLNRRELKAIAESIPVSDIKTYRLAIKSGRAPAEGLEMQLAELWSSLLNLDVGSIGAEDNFFKLGGDSLMAMRLVSAAKTKGIILTVTSVFKKSTLENMAVQAQAQASMAQKENQDTKPFSLAQHLGGIDTVKTSIADKLDIDTRVIDDIYPCTAMQAGLISLSAKTPGAYVSLRNFKLPSNIDVDHFCHAWQMVYQSEPVLRTRIIMIEPHGFFSVIVNDKIEWESADDEEDLPDECRLLPATEGDRLGSYAIIGEGTSDIRFVWFLHHALYDAWSAPFILQKVKNVYDNEFSGSIPRSPRFSNFIAYLSGIDSAESDEFWRVRFAGTASAQFPKLPSPTYRANANTTVRRKIPVAAPKSSEITMASLIRATWSLVVAAYSGNDEVTFHETLAGRDAPVEGIEEMIGATLTTVPTRIRINRRNTIEGFLNDIQTYAIEARPYQYAGLQRIQRLSADAALACSAQSLIAISPSGHSQGNDLFQEIDADKEANDSFYTYPIMMTCYIANNHVDLEVHHDQNIVPQWLLARILSHFDFILTSLVDSQKGSAQLHSLKVPSTVDLNTIRAWNSTPIPQTEKCIHEIIHAHARSESSSANAVSAWDMTIDYKELDQLSTSLAWKLCEAGVQKDSMVPLYFDKSGSTIVSILAVLKVGAAFILLSPDQPLARLRIIVQDAEAQTILCSPRHTQVCCDLAAKIIPVSYDSLRVLKTRTQQPFDVSPSAIAYLIYTSGSTGKPKGTLISHTAFCTGALAHAAAMDLTSSSRTLQFASYLFDASVMEIISTLLVGGCVCVADDETRLTDIAKTIKERQVNWSLLTPSFVQTLKPDSVPTLKTLVMGGEAMSTAHITTWADRVKFMNAFGPSEASVVASVNSNVTMECGPSNIGYPVGCRVWVVDANDPSRLVPLGCVGEMLIDGPILARGYHKDAAKTADAFITVPEWLKNFDSNVNSTRRLYRTGDLVKYAHDGSIIFIGRKDTQVKINGIRIELGEPDHHLASDPVVLHSTVIYPSKGPFRKKLLAVMSLKDVKASTPGNDELRLADQSSITPYLAPLRQRLSGLLPPYMIPSLYIVLERMPLLPSGKLDRKTILNWVETASSEIHRQVLSIQSSSEALDREASDLETQLRDIVASVLHLQAEKVPFTQSLLSLGADSIQAMQLMSRCRAAGLVLKIQDIMSSKNIVQLTETMTIAKQTVQVVEESGHEFALSPIQKFYFDSIGENHHFNQSISFILRQKIEPGQIQSAITKVVTRHPMLRARFNQNEHGIWTQRITNDISQSFSLTIYREAMSIEQIAERFEASHKSLNVFNGPLTAVNLFTTLEDDQQLLCICAHHLVVDIVSWRIMSAEIESLLTLDNGELQPEPMSFQRWCQLQAQQAQDTNPRTILASQDIPEADHAYWGMDNMVDRTADAIEQAFELDPHLTSELLVDCHKSMNTELVDILIASVLYSFSKAFPDRQTIPTLFNEGHGREAWDDIDLSETISWFTTLTPIHLPWAAKQEDNLIKCIRWVKDLRRRIPGKGRPYFAYRQLTEDGQTRYAQHRTMEIIFNYLGQTQHTADSNSLLLPASEDLQGKLQFDHGADVPRFALFDLAASLNGSRLRFTFGYNKHIKHQDRIKKWVIACQSALTNAASALIKLGKQETMALYPVLPLTWNGLENLEKSLPRLGISSLADIETVYPCSPMQRGMLLSQVKDPLNYSYQSTFLIKHAQPGQLIDTERLSQAWDAVVEKHASLRSVFVDELVGPGSTAQVVLKHHTPQTLLVNLEATTAQDTLMNYSAPDYTAPVPPHRIIIAQTSTGDVYGRLDMSHSIIDGASMSLLFKELSAAYGHDLAPSTTQYAAYIQHIQASSAEEDMTYWKDHLKEVEPCIFPNLTDGKQEPRRLDSIDLNILLNTAVTEYCAKNSITISTLLQLTWALVLRVYTGNRDVCFGYLVSGRDAPIQDIDQIIGVFINMLTCRFNFQDDARLSTTLQKVQESLAAGMGHQSVPLADIQHALGLGTTIFNTVFSLQKRESSPDQNKDVLDYQFLDYEDPSEFLLTLNVELTEDNVEVSFTYWTDTISKPQISGIVSVFEHVFDSIVNGNDKELGKIDYLSSNSLTQLKEWHNKPLPRLERCVHEMFVQHAREQPLAPAIDAWDGRYTYAELDAVSDKLAIYLISLGLQVGQFVPLIFEKSGFTIIAEMGVLKAGMAFVPIAPDVPESRLEFLLDNVKAPIVLCSASLEGRISKTAKSVLVVSDTTLDALPARGRQPLAKVDSHDMAYAIFTSGTTGLPKGTIIEHGAICTGGTEHAKAMFMKKDSRILQFASYTFDASIMEIISGLIIGACIVVPTDHERMSDIPGVIERMKATWTLLTPSVAGILKPEAVPSLKTLVTGGEAMSKDHIVKWKGKGIALVNAYGPSECSVVATTHTKVDESGRELDHEPANIGHAVGSRGWVVNPDNHNQLVPTGAIGELLIEGRITARSYLNNEEKTKAVFKTLPAWMARPDLQDILIEKERCYLTGDLVRRNTDGTFNYITRKDTQIKLNGQRIEVMEIESHVKSNLPETSQAAVDLVAPAEGRKVLAVFFSSPELQAEKNEIDEILLPMASTAAQTASAVQVGLKSALQAYMIPNLYIPVTKIPWTASGKMDRSRLKNIVTKLSKEELASYKLGAGSTVTQALPQTEMEKKLQAFWAEALEIKIETIGASDNFFRLGGDSIIAMKLVNISAANQISLATIDVFRNPKLSDMAELCTIMKKGSDSLLEPFILLPDTIPREEIVEELAFLCQIPEQEIQDAYPCSRLQEGLLALTVKQAGAYVARYVFNLPSDIRKTEFQAAWQKTVDEVDILRTRIPHGESFGFMQVLPKKHAITWQQARTIEDTFEQTLIPSHNGGALTRYYLEEQPGGGLQFVFLIHHALYDGWSLPLVLSRVEENYKKLITPPTRDEGISPAPFVNFIQFLRETSPEASDDFWQSRLTDAGSASHFPAAKQPGDGVAETHQESHTFTIRKDLHKMGVTLPVILRAAWSILLSAYTNSDSVLFGETLAGRDVPVHRVTEICGPTLTTVPQKIQVDRDLTVQQYLQYVQRLSTDVISYQHAGLQHIKRLGTDPTAACDFQNLLVIQAPQDGEDDSLFHAEGTEAGANFFTYPLVLECNIKTGQVNVEAHYWPAVLSQVGIQRLLSQLDIILQQLGKDILYKHVGAIEVISKQDLEAIKASKFAAEGAWIVDSFDPNKLAPVGAIGELLLETPTEGQDSSAFSPSWAVSMGLRSASLYRTGQLARYNSNGSVARLGPKDNRVTLRGQHVDLRDVEHLITARPQIKKAIVSIPKSGPCSKKLTAVVSINGLAAISIPVDSLALIQDATRLADARARLEKAQIQLVEEAPPHMIPAIWVIVEDFPAASSGQPVPRQVTSWLEELDQSTYRTIMDSNTGSVSLENQGEAVALLRKIWSEIFAIPAEQIPDHASFVATLGGDSISAMQVMSKARKEGFVVSLQDILKSSSIVSLAGKMTNRAQTLASTGGKQEVADEEFDLSPVQKLYFEFIDPSGRAQFNQSQIMSVNRKISASKVEEAIQHLVGKHSMLRARFTKSSTGWTQRITNNITGSYRFVARTCNANELVDQIELSQKAMNVVTGPLLSCNLFEDRWNGAQSIFIAAHHLVVDAVSWSPILQDLEILLTKGSADLATLPLSFQSWVRLQAQQAENVTTEEIPKLMPIKARPSDLAYWHMEKVVNTYGDVETRTFELDKAASTLALGSANNTFGTEPVDLMISAIAQSFRTTFKDRMVPAIYNESHGREWDDSIDLSSTVGWFTTITPIQLKPKDNDDVFQAVRLVKDIRKRIPSNGRPYFAYRNSKASQTKFSNSLPIEILFNYLGRSAPAGHGDSLLQNMDLPDDDSTQMKISDVGMNTARLALFEISAGVADGKIKFTFMFNRNMKHALQVRQWVKNCQQTLQDLAKQLSARKQEPTLTDFPLLPIGYDDLPKIMARTLPKAGVGSLDQVEDIYPCSPTQEGVLLSQLRNPKSYIFHEINEVIPRGIVVSPQKLVESWSQVVARHSILRTLFTDSFYKGGNFDQIVLKQVDTGAVLIEAKAADDEEAIKMLNAVNIQEHNYARLPRLPHQMSCVQTVSGKVFMKLEMTHAVIDGASSANILKDIALAYEDKLEPDGPRYSDYISFIRRQTPTSSIRHFKNYLARIEPCLFPTLNQTNNRQLNFVMVDFDAYPELVAICKEGNVTLASMMQAAFAILLRKYAKSDDISFGYLTSGRDAPVNGLLQAVGLFINMLICRVQFDEETTLSSIFKRVQHDYLEMLPYQYSSLAKVQHELNLDGKTLFNTAVSIQGSAASNDEGHIPSNIRFEPIAAADPSEYAITANIYVKPGEEGCLFRYWTNFISVEQASELAQNMGKILRSIIRDPNQKIKDLDKIPSLVLPTKTPVSARVSALIKEPRLVKKNSNVSFQESVKSAVIDEITKSSELSTAMIPGAISPASRLSQDSSRSTSTGPTEIGTPQIQNMVKDAVREALEAIFASGRLVMYNNQTTGNGAISRSRSEQEFDEVARRFDETPAPRTYDDVTKDFEESPTPVGEMEDEYIKKYTKGMKVEKPTDDIIKINKTVQKVTEHYPQTPQDYSDNLKMLWGETLNIDGEHIQQDSSYFELGGDSILAMEMAGLARENGLLLTVADIFQNPYFGAMSKTIHGLNDVVKIQEVTTEYKKEVIKHGTKAEPYEPFSLLKMDKKDIPDFLHEHVCPQVGIFRGGIQDVLPVTDFQSFAIAGAVMQSRFMLNYFHLEGSGQLNLRKLRDAVAHIVENFDIFRTVFIQYKDRFLQVILRVVDAQIDMYETDDLDAYLIKMRDNDIATGHPRLGSLFSQFSVIKKKDSPDHKIVLRLSHAQYDGISVDKILTTLKQVYEGQPQTSNASYGTFINYTLGSDREPIYDYWRNLLEGSQMAEPVKRSKVNLNRGDARLRTLNKTVNLPNLAAHNITDATIIKAAWTLVLAQLTSCGDVVFGQLVNGRILPVEGIADIVGPCLNYTPVRVKLDKDWSGLDLLKYIQDQHVSSMPYQGLGFRELIKNCTSWSKARDFTTMVHHLNIAEHGEWTLGEIPYKVAALGSGSNTEDFEIVSRPKVGGKVEIELSYANDGCIHPDLARIAHELVCDAVEGFAKPNQLLADWTGTPHTVIEKPIPEDTSVTGILSTLDEPRLSAARYVVSEAWSTILPKSSISDSATFFTNGDFVGAALVSQAFLRRGYKISVEDIIDHPSFKHHMGLIASQQKHEADLGSETSTLKPPAVVEVRQSLWRNRIKKVFGRDNGKLEKKGEKKGEKQKGKGGKVGA